MVPYPPNLGLANSMVPLVLADSPCTKRYDVNSMKQFKHGQTWFDRHGGHAMGLSCVGIPQKNISKVIMHQNTKKTKV